MTLVGNQLLPGTVLVSGGPITWTIIPSYGSIATEAMTGEGVYGCAGSTCNSGVTNNQFMTSATTARPIGTLMQSFDGQTIPGRSRKWRSSAFCTLPSYITIAADTAGGGLPNIGLLNLANGQNAKNTFLVSLNGAGAFGIGYNADCFTCNSGVSPRYGFLILRDQEKFQRAPPYQLTMVGMYRDVQRLSVPSRASNSTLTYRGTRTLDHRDPQNQKPIARRHSRIACEAICIVANTESASPV